MQVKKNNKKRKININFTGIKDKKKESRKKPWTAKQRKKKKKATFFFKEFKNT